MASTIPSNSPDLPVASSQDSEESNSNNNNNNSSSSSKISKNSKSKSKSSKAIALKPPSSEPLPRALQESVGADSGESTELPTSPSLSPTPSSTSTVLSQEDSPGAGGASGGGTATATPIKAKATTKATAKTAAQAAAAPTAAATGKGAGSQSSCSKSSSGSKMSTRRPYRSLLTAEDLEGLNQHRMVQSIFNGIASLFGKPETMARRSRPLRAKSAHCVPIKNKADLDLEDDSDQGNDSTKDCKSQKEGKRTSRLTGELKRQPLARRSRSATSLSAVLARSNKGPSADPDFLRRSSLRTKDLEDLCPQLTIGALLCRWKSCLRGLTFMLQAWLSWETILAAVMALLVIRFLIPLAILKGALAMASAAVAVSECVWFGYHRKMLRDLNRVRGLQDRPGAPGSARLLFERTLSCVDIAAKWQGTDGKGRTAEAWIEGWFLGAPFEELRLGNLEEFISWGLWTRYPDELTEAEQGEMKQFLIELQARWGWCIPVGYNTDVKCMRINFDSIKAWNHPLLYYLWCWVLRISARRTMGLFGFSHQSTAVDGLSYLHYKPAKSKNGVLTVNGSVPSEDELTPIVFIHGLGVGLAPYLRFVWRLAALREVFVVELLEVSQSGSTKVLNPEEMPEAVATMLQQHGHSRACFISHSYGTFVTSWITRARPRLVEKLVLLDPVCFMLAQPDVAFNFLYREPRNLFSHVVANFVRSEIFSANVLMRHFYWYHNTMWPEEMPADTIVALGGNDDIIHASFVRRYLEEYARNQQEWRQQQQQQQDVESSNNSKQESLPQPIGQQSLKILWYEDFFHGEVLLNKVAQLQVMQFI